MIDCLKAMATFMKKFKRKRRVSTELHSRWGDVSITYPTQGSWNQWNHPSDYANKSAGKSEENQPYRPAGPLRRSSSGTSSKRSRSIGTREHQVGDLPFPTGYFDQNIRHRMGDSHTPPSHTPPGQGLGLDDLSGGPHRRPPSSIINDECTTDESCDDEEEEEERDTLGPRIQLSPREYSMGDVSHTPHDHPEDFDIPAKSPLSVTSRMRRCSFQSCATEPTASISGGTNSRRTSFTAASSISAPSMPPSTPRVACTPKQPPPEKRYPPPIKQEPETTPQEMVPSYDELYG
ncbi:hypothetical protein N7463_006262 [Penicillium fimorum]|uniref:Uncharacterized protein n=1 Tax=Penicillium fimorum TaxID=1882269 RepID=A0A9X0C5W7_9EURO|nr:hypothetical protein N7463_006262 [Penicillium fimorum]